MSPNLCLVVPFYNQKGRHAKNYCFRPDADACLIILSSADLLIIDLFVK
jgi:hypothetical protein